MEHIKCTELPYRDIYIGSEAKKNKKFTLGHLRYILLFLWFLEDNVYSDRIKYRNCYDRIKNCDDDSHRNVITVNNMIIIIMIFHSIYWKNNFLVSNFTIKDKNIFLNVGLYFIFFNRIMVVPKKNEKDTFLICMLLVILRKDSLAIGIFLTRRTRSQPPRHPNIHSTDFHFGEREVCRLYFAAPPY